jgi:integrase
MGLHVLRHSAAAAMIHSGAPPEAVQQILGHRSAAFTLTVYGHIFDAEFDEVADELERKVRSRANRSQIHREVRSHLRLLKTPPARNSENEPGS